MSRTKKVHTHKSPGIRFAAASHRAKVKAKRSASKSAIKKMSDPESLEFSFETKRRNVPSKDGSAGYLDPTKTEAEFLKELRSAKQSIANGSRPWPEYFVLNKALHKDIINRIKQQDPSFEGDIFQAINRLSDEELEECVHRFYASKGLKEVKQ